MILCVPSVLPIATAVHVFWVFIFFIVEVRQARAIAQYNSHCFRDDDIRIDYSCILSCFLMLRCDTLFSHRRCRAAPEAPAASLVRGGMHTRAPAIFCCVHSLQGRKLQGLQDPEFESMPKHTHTLSLSLVLSYPLLSSHSPTLERSLPLTLVIHIQLHTHTHTQPHNCTHSHTHKNTQTHTVCCCSC